jgi:gluconolactonase
MTTSGPSFRKYNDLFDDIVGPNAKIEVLYEDQTLPFAHEAGVYIPETGDLWITSDQYQEKEGDPKKIRISRVSGVDCGEINVEAIEPDPAILSMPNGGVNYQDGVLFCAQGDLNFPGGPVYMEGKPPHRVHRLVEGFLDRQFNSLNDIVVHSDGSIWFTDPIYGYEQGIRPQPMLPNQVYRFNPTDGGIRAVADGFGRPNGICFSPDEKIVYITDTAWIHGDGSKNFQRPSTMCVHYQKTSLRCGRSPAN